MHKIGNLICNAKAENNLRLGISVVMLAEG